jgi:hypothetical protein
MTVVHHLHYSSDLAPLRLLSVSRHFDTIEVMDAKLQAVLNTLTEHDFQDAFKNGRSVWKRCIRAEGD